MPDPRLAIPALLLSVLTAVTQNNPPSQIPKTWDDDAMATLEVPLADAGASPVHVSADYYYRIPVRPIYKTYPVYYPSKEPSGYFERLKGLEPEIVPLDLSIVKTENDWIRVGEIVFDAPTDYDISGTPAQFRDPSYYTAIGIPVAGDGTVPFVKYVVREKGRVEVGVLACGTCHTRVMSNGVVVKGAQGNFPFDRTAPPEIPDEALPIIRRLLKMLYGVPWLGRRDPGRQFEAMAYREIVEHVRAIPPGVQARHGTGLRIPTQIPDLIAVQERRYLDHTGLVRHRGVADLMRYAALNQAVDLYSRHGDFVPVAEDFRTVPDTSTDSPFPFANGRYSGEELYALERFDIMTRSVGTDPDLALKTRRGTGYYKVPSLKGVWYRGPFEHSGSVATLEDWFDPRRLRDDYVPTGFKGDGAATRAVKGHEYGLNLSATDKAALIAFLKTL